jgi:two-component system CAI-1 autoinducer sensor kinase/phosphatase CqsS
MVTAVLFSIFLNFITCLFLTAFLLVLKNRYKYYTLFSLNLSVWSLFYGLSISADNANDALMYNKITLIFISLIPYLAFNFAKEYADYKVSRKVNKLNNLIMILLVISSASPYIIDGVRPYMEYKFAPTISPFFLLNTLYFGVYVTYCHYILYQKSKKEGGVRSKIIFYGYLIGFLGGSTNWFFYLGIPLYPLGNFLIVIHTIIITYAIIKHRLFDISVVITESITRIIAMIILGLIYFGLSSLYTYLIPNSNKIINNVFYFSLLLAAFESYNFLVKKSHLINSQIISTNTYKYEDLLKEINRELTGMTDIGSLWNKMVQIFHNLQIKIVSFAVVKDDSELEFFGENMSNTLPPDFLNKLRNLEFSVVYEEAPLWLKGVFTNYKKSSCLIPFISENKVVGFMMVEKESNKGNFGYNNLVLFDNLTFQIAIIIDRIEVYRKFSTQKQKFLEEKAKSLKSLAGTIAHEIRNPLNTISLSQNQIKELLTHSNNSVSDNKEKLINLTSSIADSIDQANDIINIILNDLKEKPIDPSEFSYQNSTVIMNDIVKKYGYHSESEMQRVKLELKDEFTFKAVPDRFVFIVYNLLKNAIHYFNQYPNATITIGTQKSGSFIGGASRKIIANGNSLNDHDLSNYSVIYVYDTGPGISDEVLPMLFNDFFTAGKKDGTGLGLSFCKRNMIAFGGNIVCETEFGKYTKFSLLFPKVTDDFLSKVQADAKKKKILIVDDQQINLITAKSRVEHNLPDIICDVTLTGQRAIDLAKENNYCLILMDINMPEMDGVEATAKIREFNKDVPIIAHTSITYQEFMQQTKNATSIFSDYITKPIHDNRKYRTIAKWIFDYKDDLTYLKDDEYKLALKNSNIIVADDQKSSLMIVAKTLELFGCKVTAVENGTELLEAYKKSLDKNNHSNFDLIITDMNMPGLNGDQAIKEIRKTNSEIPIIVLSGDGQQKDIYKFLDVGATDYFIKGNKPELLIKIAANYLTMKNPKSQ